MHYRITLAIVLAFSIVASALPGWDFANAATSVPWTNATRLTATPTQEGLQLELTAWDSNLAADLDLDPAECGGLAIEYCAEGFETATSGQLFFQTAASPDYDEQKEIILPPLNCDGEWHAIAVDCAQVRGGKRLWTDGGRITGVRLDLADQFPGRIILRSIKMLPPKQPLAETLGLPDRRAVELPTTRAAAAATAVDPDAPVFTSPMAAPANGGFDHVGHCYLRRDFELKATARQALMQSVCDDEIAAVYLNGHRIDHDWSVNWKRSDAVEIPPDYLVPGRNLLAVDYVNTGSVGGLMLDLQVVGEDGSFELITLDGAVGSIAPNPENWMSPAAITDWPLAATRPGPPAPPWHDYPPYRSIQPTENKLEVVLLEQNGTQVEIALRGTPALDDSSRLVAKLYCQNVDKPVLTLTGTFAELGGQRQPDGSYLFRLDDRGYLRYGAPLEASWEFGMHGRQCSGDTTVAVHLGDRPMPGEPAVLKLAQTPNGPVPMLNGKPFYFNVLTVDSFQVSSGVEGPGSPFNVVVSRAGGQNPEWWIGPGQYDFTALDRQLNFALANYPDAMLGFYVWCQPGLWYGRTYPERMSRDENGSTYGYYVSAISFSNPEYRADAAHALAAFVEHCEKYFGPRMALYNLMGGATCEWQGWTCHTERFSDYSDTEARQFAKFAAEHQRQASTIPTPTERTRGNADGEVFRNVITDWKSILYDEFYNRSMAACIDELAHAAKTACGGAKLVGAYYGYLLEYATLGYCVNSGGHNDLRRLLDSPDLDFFLSPQSYHARALGGPNAEMKPFAAIREAGKLSMVEDDTRTHLIPATAHDQTLNLADTIAVFQRNLGMYLAHGVPLNQLPLVGGNELAHPAIKQLFLRALAAGQFRYEHPAPLRAEVAAVVDQDSIRYLIPTIRSVQVPEDRRFVYSSTGDFVESSRYTLPVSGELLYYQRYPLAQCGTAVDWLLLDDVPRLASQYKLVILLGAYADTPALRHAVAALKAAGTKVLVAYGAGFIDPAEQGFSAAPMNELLGMAIHQVKAGSLAVKFPDGHAVGGDYTVTPRFCVEDAEATTLAHYATNPDLVAVAAKGNALFYGGALLDAKFVRETARAAGAHIYCDSDDNLCAGNGFIVIHAIQPGTKTIRLPKPADVTDLFTGELLGRNVTEVSFAMDSFQTRVLITGNADEHHAAFGK